MHKSDVILSLCQEAKSNMISDKCELTGRQMVHGLISTQTTTNMVTQRLHRSEQLYELK